MPKTNPLVSDIHSLYIRSTLHHLIYAFIEGAQWTLPSLSKKDAAEAFLKRFSAFVGEYTSKDVIDIYDAVNRDILNRNGKKGPQ